MPTYRINNTQSTPAEQGVRVSSGGIDLQGRRLVFQNTANWVFVNGAGKMAAAGPNAPGIYTQRQMPCIAVIVANFNGLVWTGAHLAHVSGDQHSKLNELYNDHTDGNSYVAIGAKGSMIESMQRIRSRFAAKAFGVWVYVAGDNSPDFGMNREGFFGETAPQ
jgi:hypothetical protein